MGQYSSSLYYGEYNSKGRPVSGILYMTDTTRTWKGIVVVVMGNSIMGPVQWACDTRLVGIVNRDCIL